MFILLYIIVVGPLDYLLLKYVFKSLEWTWITFPMVVFAVKLCGLFHGLCHQGQGAAHQPGGLIDFDLRTQLGEKQRPAKAYIYGQSFFTLLSPHIQNYTVGLEPNPAFWAQKLENPLSADALTWVGQAESSYQGIGSSSRQSLFRRPYYFAEDAVGLRGVPIPVWTTKCFMATWNATLPQLPFTVDLVHRVNDPQDILISGKLMNHLPVDLEDVWLFYRNKIARVADVVPGKKSAEHPIQLHGFEFKELLFRGMGNRRRQDGCRPANQIGQGRLQSDRPDEAHSLL